MGGQFADDEIVPFSLLEFFAQQATLDRLKDFSAKGTKYLLFALKREKP